MHLRSLNGAGVTEFRAFLNEVRQTDQPVEVPVEILTTSSTSTELARNIEMEVPSTATTKKDVAEYLHEVLEPLPSEDVLSRAGMWSWLGLFMFNTICPQTEAGLRQVREDWYYAFQPDDGHPNYQTYYRHLLYTPYLLYRSFGGEVGRALLAGPASVGGDMIEQIASRQEYISCRPVLATLDRLYFDDKHERVMRGATDRNRDGSLRRYVAFLQQIDTTHDLYGMSSEKITDLLPPEFDEWKERG